PPRRRRNGAPDNSLWWSGVAAGLSISFSLFAQAIIQTHLPAMLWRPLFTEYTVTAVLPVMADINLTNLAKLTRMWAVVLLANFCGTLFAALFCTFTPVLSPYLYQGMLDIS